VEFGQAANLVPGSAELRSNEGIALYCDDQLAYAVSALQAALKLNVHWLHRISSWASAPTALAIPRRRHGSCRRSSNLNRTISWRIYGWGTLW